MSSEGTPPAPEPAPAATPEPEAAGAAPPHDRASPASEERQWAMLCHVSGLLLYVTYGIGNLVAVLAIWLLKRRGMPFVALHGREALNYQITLLLAFLASFPLMLIVVGVVIYRLLLVYHLGVSLWAAWQAIAGKPFRYPFIWRPIR